MAKSACEFWATMAPTVAAEALCANAIAGGGRGRGRETTGVREDDPTSVPSAVAVKREIEGSLVVGSACVTKGRLDQHASCYGQASTVCSPVPVEAISMTWPCQHCRQNGRKTRLIRLPVEAEKPVRSRTYNNADSASAVEHLRTCLFRDCVRYTESSEVCNEVGTLF